MYEQPYRKLLVWQAARELTLAVYRVTQAFPTEEKYGLVSQLRRASVSVVANIVEGQAKRSNADHLRFLDISVGSLAECAALTDLSRDLGYIKETDYDSLMRLHGRTSYFLRRFVIGNRSR